MYGKKYARTKYMLQLVQQAMKLAESNLCSTDEEAIVMLGEGKVAEETLAIAVYCALRYPSSFEKAVIASVNHGGDSDSTGAVTGNLMGACLGNEVVPARFRDNVEEVDTIEAIAERLLLKNKSNNEV